MTDKEFVERVLAAEEKYDSDFLAWEIEEIAEEYRNEAQA